MQTPTDSSSGVRYLDLEQLSLDEEYARVADIVRSLPRKLHSLIRFTLERLAV